MPRGVHRPKPQTMPMQLLPSLLQTKQAVVIQVTDTIIIGADFQITEAVLGVNNRIKIIHKGSSLSSSSSNSSSSSISSSNTNLVNSRQLKCKTNNRKMLDRLAISNLNTEVGLANIQLQGRMVTLILTLIQMQVIKIIIKGKIMVIEDGVVIGGTTHSSKG